MIIEFKSGKVIANQHEIVVRIKGEHFVTMQAQTDAVQLISGANVISVNGSECKWSVKLDNEEQLNMIAEITGVAAE